MVNSGYTPSISTPTKPRQGRVLKVSVSSENIKGGLALTTAALTIAMFTILARAVAPMLGSIPQTALRFLLAAGILAMINATRRKVIGIGRSDAILLLALGALSVMLGVLLVVAVTHAKVGNALSVLYASGIIAALVIGAVFFGEKITMVKAVAVILALAGLGMYANDLTMLNIGIPAAVAAGICDSASNALRKRLRRLDRSVAVMWQYGIGAALIIPVLYGSGVGRVGRVTWWPVVALVLFALLSVLLGRMQFYGFARFDVNAGSVVLSSQVFFAMLLGLVILNERPTVREAIGSVLIFSAAVAAAVGSSVASKGAKSWHRGSKQRPRSACPSSTCDRATPE